MSRKLTREYIDGLESQVAELDAKLKAARHKLAKLTNQRGRLRAALHGLYEDVRNYADWLEMRAGKVRKLSVHDAQAFAWTLRAAEESAKAKEKGER